MLAHELCRFEIHLEAADEVDVQRVHVAEQRGEPGPRPAWHSALQNFAAPLVIHIAKLHFVICVRPLDFGHWSAHKLESLSEHELRHGEAVAIGLALDCRYSVERGWLAEADWQRIFGLLSSLGFELFHPALLQRDADGALSLLRGLREFQEHLGGELTVTQLRAPGRPFDVNEMDPDTIELCIERLQGYASAQAGR
jgi:hypothetical protein